MSIAPIRNSPSSNKPLSWNCWQMYCSSGADWTLTSPINRAWTNSSLQWSTSIFRKPCLANSFPITSNTSLTQSRRAVRVPEQCAVRRSRYLPDLRKDNVDSEVNVQVEFRQRSQRTGQSQLQKQLSHSATHHTDSGPQTQSLRFGVVSHHQTAGCQNQNLPTEMDSLLAHTRIRPHTLSSHLGLHLLGGLRVSQLQKQTSVLVCRCHVPLHVHLHAQSSAN